MPAFTAGVSPKSSAWKMTFTAGRTVAGCEKNEIEGAVDGSRESENGGEAFVGGADTEVQAAEVIGDRHAAERLDAEDALRAERKRDADPFEETHGGQGGGDRQRDEDAARPEPLGEQAEKAGHREGLGLGDVEAADEGAVD